MNMMEIRVIMYLALVLLATATTARGGVRGESTSTLLDPSKLEKFVDELPRMPKIQGFRDEGGVVFPASLIIGMYQKTWRFHRDIPPSLVFAYGTSKDSATIPGPTIEAMQGVATHVTWENHLPAHHILPWDRTIPTAIPSGGGVPTVVHLHGGVNAPSSDGYGEAWFTAGFKSRGSAWSRKTYTYLNVQEPGNLWYHDHTMGLTRENLLAGLAGVYTVRNPAVESPLGLPSGDDHDFPLVLSDRTFRTNGSIYMNSTGNNPTIHPQWQPEYFGDAIVVNGKVWPYLRVQRRRYRFRILNASNARFFRLFFTNGLRFFHVGSDSTYISRPVANQKFLIAPSEMVDLVVDFAESSTGEAVLSNDARYPYPTGARVDGATNGVVMKFVVDGQRVVDRSRVPARLVEYPAAWRRREAATVERYITMFEYTSKTGEPTHLYLNGRTFSEPVTETPRQGSTELWNVINLTGDNHPLHIHLGLLTVVEQRVLSDVEGLKACMLRLNSDARRCRAEEHAAAGRVEAVSHQERGWKNVFKVGPGRMTRMLVRFALLRPGLAAKYPFNATVEPGYVYHCHILDHEDNVMMRPLKLRP